MRWRHDVTNLTSPISACRSSKVTIHMYFCNYFDCWVPSWYCVCTCMMFSYHNVTWRHDVTKITTWRQETNCLHPSLQMCSRADSISFLWFLWWLNSTRLLSSYLHDSMMSRNDVMTSLNMLYLSQLVDVLARWFFFCFYCFSGWQVQKYYWFCICICGYVIKWRYDVMAWLYDVT